MEGYLQRKISAGMDGNAAVRQPPTPPRRGDPTALHSPTPRPGALASSHQSSASSKVSADYAIKDRAQSSGSTIEDMLMSSNSLLVFEDDNRRRSSLVEHDAKHDPKKDQKHDRKNYNTWRGQKLNLPPSIKSSDENGGRWQKPAQPLNTSEAERSNLPRVPDRTLAAQRPNLAALDTSAIPSSIERPSGTPMSVSTISPPERATVSPHQRFHPGLPGVTAPGDPRGVTAAPARAAPIAASARFGRLLEEFRQLTEKCNESVTISSSSDNGTWQDLSDPSTHAPQDYDDHDKNKPQGISLHLKAAVAAPAAKTDASEKSRPSADSVTEVSTDRQLKVSNITMDPAIMSLRNSHGHTSRGSFTSGLSSSDPRLMTEAERWQLKEIKLRALEQRQKAAASLEKGEKTAFDLYSDLTISKEASSQEKGEKTAFDLYSDLTINNPLLMTEEEKRQQQQMKLQTLNLEKEVPKDRTAAAAGYGINFQPRENINFQPRENVSFQPRENIGDKYSWLSYMTTGTKKDKEESAPAEKQASVKPPSTAVPPKLEKVSPLESDDLQILPRGSGSNRTDSNFSEDYSDDASGGLLVGFGQARRRQQLALPGSEPSEISSSASSSSSTYNSSGSSGTGSYSSSGSSIGSFGSSRSSSGSSSEDSGESSESSTEESSGAPAISRLHIHNSQSDLVSELSFSGASALMALMEAQPFMASFATGGRDQGPGQGRRLTGGSVGVPNNRRVDGDSPSSTRFPSTPSKAAPRSARSPSPEVRRGGSGIFGKRPSVGMDPTLEKLEEVSESNASFLDDISSIDGRNNLPYRKFLLPPEGNAAESVVWSSSESDSSLTGAGAGIQNPQPLTSSSVSSKHSSLTGASAGIQSRHSSLTGASAEIQKPQQLASSPASSKRSIQEQENLPAQPLEETPSYSAQPMDEGGKDDESSSLKPDVQKTITKSISSGIDSSSSNSSAVPTVPRLVLPRPSNHNNSTSIPSPSSHRPETTQRHYNPKSSMSSRSIGSASYPPHRPTARPGIPKQPSYSSLKSGQNSKVGLYPNSNASQSSSGSHVHKQTSHNSLKSDQNSKVGPSHNLYSNASQSSSGSHLAQNSHATISSSGSYYDGVVARAAAMQSSNVDGRSPTVPSAGARSLASSRSSMRSGPSQSSRSGLSQLHQDASSGAQRAGIGTIESGPSITSWVEQQRRQQDGANEEFLSNLNSQQGSGESPQQNVQHTYSPLLENASPDVTDDVLENVHPNNADDMSSMSSVVSKARNSCGRGDPPLAGTSASQQAVLPSKARDESVGSKACSKLSILSEHSPRSEKQDEKSPRNPILRDLSSLGSRTMDMDRVDVKSSSSKVSDLTEPPQQKTAGEMSVAEPTALKQEPGATVSEYASRIVSDRSTADDRGGPLLGGGVGAESPVPHLSSPQTDGHDDFDRLSTKSGGDMDSSVGSKAQNSLSRGGMPLPGTFATTPVDQQASQQTVPPKNGTSESVGSKASSKFNILSEHSQGSEKLDRKSPSNLLLRDLSSFASQTMGMDRVDVKSNSSKVSDLTEPPHHKTAGEMSMVEPTALKQEPGMTVSEYISSIVSSTPAAQDQGGPLLGGSVKAASPVNYNVLHLSSPQKNEHDDFDKLSAKSGGDMHFAGEDLYEDFPSRVSDSDGNNALPRKHSSSSQLVVPTKVETDARKPWRTMLKESSHPTETSVDTGLTSHLDSHENFRLNSPGKAAEPENDADLSQGSGLPELFQSKEALKMMGLYSSVVGSPDAKGDVPATTTTAATTVTGDASDDNLLHLVEQTPVIACRPKSPSSSDSPSSTTERDFSGQQANGTAEVLSANAHDDANDIAKEDGQSESNSSKIGIKSAGPSDCSMDRKELNEIVKKKGSNSKTDDDNDCLEQNNEKANKSSFRMLMDTTNEMTELLHKSLESRTEQPIVDSDDDGLSFKSIYRDDSKESTTNSVIESLKSFSKDFVLTEKVTDRSPSPPGDQARDAFDGEEEKVPEGVSDNGSEIFDKPLEISSVDTDVGYSLDAVGATAKDDEPRPNPFLSDSSDDEDSGLPLSVLPLSIDDEDAASKNLHRDQKRGKRKYFCCIAVFVIAATIVAVVVYVVLTQMEKKSEGNRSSENEPSVKPPSAPLPGTPLATAPPTPMPTPLPTINENPNWVQVGGDLEGQSPGDEAGFSIAVSDNGRVIIGARRNAKDGLKNRGAARIFEFDSNIGSYAPIWNIYGESAGDQCGFSVTISKTGNRVAVGSLGNDRNGQNSGQVRIFDQNELSNTWNLVSELYGEDETSLFGASVSLSQDGSYLAVGAPYHSESTNMTRNGRAYVYREIQDSEWDQVGKPMVGTSNNDLFGWSVSFMPNSAQLVAVGAPRLEGSMDSGYVKVFSLELNGWEMYGESMGVGISGDRFGFSVSLAGDDALQRVAVGAPGTGKNGEGSGLASVYENNGAGWYHTSDDLLGDGWGDNLGYAVAMTPDATRMTVGVPNKKLDGVPVGQVQVVDVQSSGVFGSAGKIYGHDGEKFGVSVAVSYQGRLVYGGASEANLVRIYGDIP